MNDAMDKFIIRPFNVVDNAHLPEISVDKTLTDGDPLEIEGEMYYVCENADNKQSDPSVVGVIPLVVRNPANVENINEYIKCLSLAHRKVLFKNANGICDIDNCDEMVIS
jgi:hypothetical protein